VKKPISLESRRNVNEQSMPDSPEKAEKVKLLLSPEEAANALSLSKAQVYKLLALGVIRSLKIGRTRRIPVKALEDWIDELLAA
jgi:excisionase family DNA binding protein